ncbi:MAG: hypothetical protein ACSLE2_18210 [Lysobacterales bacterium]
MKHFPKLIVLAGLLLGLAACQDSDNDADPQAAADPAPSADARFDSAMSKKACELLSAELVAATFAVPADALTQSKVMGCRYIMDEGDGQTLEAGLSMLRVYDSEAGAADWFASATRSRTAEEMKAEMDMVAGRLEKSEQLDSELKKSTAKSLLSMVDTKAVNFENVAGVGDEARVSDDGTVYVRVDNLTFMVSAYQGAKAPPPDFQGADLQQMAAIAKENAAQWAIETAPQRRADGARLAGAIVDAL